MASINDIAIVVLEPADFDHPTECPDCGFDAVLEFPTSILDATGVTPMPPIKACARCFAEREREEGR